MLTGVYGSGKSTAAVEIADRLEAADFPSAVIDVDWLGWYSVPGGWDEHDDPRLTMANLAAMRATYLGAGVRFFVLAWRIRRRHQLERLRDALQMPIAVVRLDVPLGVIERRLAPDPTTSRADDLRVAAADLATGEDGLPAADLTVDADRPVERIAEQVLDYLGWAAPADAGAEPTPG